MRFSIDDLRALTLYSPDDAAGGAESDPDAQPDPNPSGQTDEEKERLRAELERAMRERDQASDLARTLADNWHSRQAESESRSQPAPQPDPEPDFDDMTPAQIAAYFKRESEKMIEERVNSAVSNIEQRYNYDRQHDHQRWYQTERRRLESAMRDSGFDDDLVNDIDAFIERENIKPEILSAPGVLERIAQTVIGERVWKEKRTASTRAPSLSSSSRGAIPDDSSRINEELALLRSKGINLSEDEWKEARDVELPFAEMLRDKMGG